MTATTAAPEKTFLGHPRGLFLLSFTETWERFQFYGMRSFLVLFLVDKTRGLGWSDAQALSFYGWYMAFIWMTPVIGGWIADRGLGQRRSIVIGGTLMSIGQLLCTLGGVPLLYAGALLVVVGNGFFKSNISTMVGQLYRAGDARRDSAFTLFYIGINVGGFLGPIVCGGLAERVNWSLGFAAAGVGMALSLLLYLVFSGRLLGEVGTPGYEQRKSATGRVQSGPLTREERDRVVVIFVISFFVIAFWAAYEQAGGLLNLFTERRVDRALLGHEVPASTFQSVNSGFVILLAPLFAVLWPWLARRGREPSTPAKMGLGLLLLASGFGLMVLAVRQADALGRASAWFVIGTYLLHTMGELALSPVGLSMVTKLAPKSLASMLMGVWFLANFAGNKLAGVIGAQAEKYGAREVFTAIGLGTAVAGLMLLALAPVLQRMTHGAESAQPPDALPAAG